MRQLKKISLILIAVFIVVITGIGLYARLREKELSAALVTRLNETINTKISYGSVTLSFIRTFPNLTVRFSDILVEPSPYYDRTQFRHEDNDTLFYASSLYVSVSVPSLLTGNIAIRSVAVRNGEINLLTDKRGNINYEVFTEKKKTGGKNIRLKNISAKNMNLIWHDRGSEIRIAGSLDDISLSGQIFRAGIFLNAAARAYIDSVNFKEMRFAEIPVNAGIRMRKSDNSLSVARGSLELADLKFDIDGNVNFKSSTADISVKGKKINISSLYSMLPDKFRSLTGNFNPSGIIDLSCILKGPYGKAGKPHLEIGYNLTGGKLSHITSGFKVNNLEFRGAITNGKLNSPETFQCTVDKLSASYGSATINGSFMFNSLVRPHLALTVDGDLNLNDLNRLINSKFINNQSGTVKFSVRLSGFIPAGSGSGLSLISSLDPDIFLSFNNFSAIIGSPGFDIKNVTGSVSIRKDLVADSLSVNLMDQHFTASCTMYNFTPWLAGKPEKMNITGNISADIFEPARFALKKNNDADDRGKPVDFFPPDVTADLTLMADSVIRKGFRASRVESRLEYRPFVYTFSNTRAKALEGDLAGTLMLGKHKDGGYIIKSTLHVSDIDINKAFSSFNNFRQTFIKSENLKGKLTGNVTLLAPLDSIYDFIMPSIVAETHLVIYDGRLLNFAPVESLSDYLDLDELKDISFSRMENDLIINNSTVSLPKMLINSSAVNFTVYGTHSFSGDYTYHLRLLLSEVLSRKARERNRGDGAFGKIRVDGTGKVTIPLKIESIGDKFDVSYDFGQIQDNIKNDIALEKQNLKGILNEEYGWYSTDTLKTRPAENKPKFTITWEEGKETATTTDTSREAVPESPLRWLLKKKR